MVAGLLLNRLKFPTCEIWTVGEAIVVVPLEIFRRAEDILESRFLILQLLATIPPIIGAEMAITRDYNRLLNYFGWGLSLGEKN